MKRYYTLSPETLKIDAARETDRIETSLRETITRRFKKKGAVVGVSGGIDSSVTAALCARALGPKRVIGLQMPERHSAPETHPMSQLLIDHLGIQTFHEDITAMLESAGFYHRYELALRQIIPEYNDGWKSKIILPSVLQEGYSVFSVVAQSPEGHFIKKRLTIAAYLGILAATNFKQRIRKMLEYYYADLHNYADIGTPNRLEYDQGFFVKLGDGAADVKPIAHLYKTQVYQLAEFLGIPQEIRSRPSTTDTYSLSQGQDEFYFSLPHDKMDLCLFGKNNGYPVDEIAKAVGLTTYEVERVLADIDAKRLATRYLHAAPVLVDAVPEVDQESSRVYAPEFSIPD